MFSYNKHDNDIIISCNFDGLNIAGLDPNKIFREGSMWTDHRLLYETVKAYAALTGWKLTFESRTCLKYSCFSRTKCKNCSTREYANGSYYPKIVNGK